MKTDIKTTIQHSIKATIENNIKEAIKEFEARENINTKFGEPLIGYADTRNPLFDMFFSRGLSEHPKGIYRPGNTVILHFVPFAEEIIQSNANSDDPSRQWRNAFRDSMWLSMRLNGVIRETLDSVGRLSSCTNTPTDWNEESCHEEWSHKMAAFAAGMGEFGPAGSFHAKGRLLGRLSSIITDGLYGDAFEPIDSNQLEKMYHKIMKKCCFKGEPGVSCGNEMINACPTGAIETDGIDRKKCQAYCKTIDEHIPSPDVCGKCFGF